MREPIIPQLEAEAFLIWEESQAEKFELHHGFAVAFAGGTLDHDRLAYNVRNHLERAFPLPCRTFGSDVKLKVANNIFYYPDVTVVCHEVVGDTTVLEAAEVVVEVLSRSTRAYDIVEKRAAYRSLPGLRAYVIVHSDFRRIEVDSRGMGGAWMTITHDEDSAYINGRPIELNAIYAQTSLAEQ